MKNIVVLDALFGDSGKGHVVQELCRQELAAKSNPAVIRSSGGPQSGHTVINDGITHICSTFGSGVLLGVPTYYHDNGVYLDPICYYKEKRKLILKGISPKIHFSPFLQVITPYDVAFNCQDLKSLQDGTCGKGVYTTIKRINDDGSYRFLYQLDNIETATIFLDDVLAYYKENHNFEYELTSDIRDLFIRTVISLANQSQHNLKYNEIDTKIWESTQGLLLDPETSPFYPHVTATSLYNPYEKYNDIYLVIRTYLTRHGNGYEPKKCDNFYDLTDKFETNEFNELQGEFKTGVLSLDLLNRVIDIHHLYKKDNLNLVITHMDIPVNQGKFHYEMYDSIVSDYDNITPEKVANTIVSNLNAKFKKVFYTDAPDSSLKEIQNV